jgi:sRNA-binding protein
LVERINKTTKGSVMTSRKRKAAVLATVTLLAERFPAAFSTFEGQRRPLKIGIAVDICEAMPEINKEHLQWALARYCMSPGYLRSLTGGAVRVGLAGDVAGTVTDEAAAKAVAMLAQVVTARRKRTAKVAREPANTTNKTAKVASRETKPVAGVASAAKSTALRMSIEAIREAAQRRRAGSGWQGPSGQPAGQPPRKTIGSFS